MTRSVVSHGKYQGICLRERRIQWQITNEDCRMLTFPVFIVGFAVGAIAASNLLPLLVAYILMAVSFLVMCWVCRVVMKTSEPVKDKT